MSGQDLGKLIDRVAASLRPHVASEEAADAVATEIVGDITSRFLVVPKPTEPEETHS